MSIANYIAEHFGENAYLLIVSTVIALYLVAFVAINNRKHRRFANVFTMVVCIVLFTAILPFPQVMKRIYIGTPDYQCEVYEKDENGNILYEDVQLIDPVTGKPKFFISGDPMVEKSPKLKQYYFINQDLTPQEGVVKIRIRPLEGGVEHYCAFDMFPNEKGTTKEEQKHVRGWFKQVQDRKKELDQANAIDELSQMSKQDIEQMAKDIAGNKSSEERAGKAKKNLDKLFEESQKQKGDQGENGDQDQSNQQGQQGAQGSQAKGQKGNRGKPGKGFTLTLPSTGEARRQLERESGEAEPRTGYSDDQPNPANNWDTSDGSGNLKGDESAEGLPPKD